MLTSVFSVARIKQGTTVMCPRFAAMLRITLGKMVGAGVLNGKLVNLEFWDLLPKKFQQISNYESSKQRKEAVRKGKKKSSPISHTPDDGDDDDDDMAEEEISHVTSRSLKRRSPVKDSESSKVSTYVYGFFILNKNVFSPFHFYSEEIHAPELQIRDKR